MNDADFVAISEPELKAIETSAAVRAGASFVPSPTKAMIWRLLALAEPLTECDVELMTDCCKSEMNDALS